MKLVQEIEYLVSIVDTDDKAPGECWVHPHAFAADYVINGCPQQATFSN